MPGKLVQHTSGVYMRVFPETINMWVSKRGGKTCQCGLAQSNRLGTQMEQNAKGGSSHICKLDSSWAGVVFAAAIARGYQTPDSLAFEHGFTPETLQGASRLSASDGGYIIGPLVLRFLASWTQQLLLSHLHKDAVVHWSTFYWFSSSREP
jgi:hypothetical protein